MAENKKAVSLDELSHFKAKQDLYNANTYQKKGETDLAGAVRYDTAQVLTEEQKAQARANIGAGTGDGSGGTVEGAVLYNAEQALNEDDKARARANIGTTDGSWENMPDKPFYKTGVNYEWDGNTEGRESFNVAGELNFYKVSDDTPTQEELVESVSLLVYDGTNLEGEIGDDKEIRLSVTDNGNLIGLFYVSEEPQIPMFFVISTLGADVDMGIDFNFTETGLYFLRGSGYDEYTRYIRKNYSVKKIEKEFLPDDINVELPEGLVTTDENGLIPASKLPSYVDDVVEGRYMELGEESSHFQTVEGFYINPERGKIYVDLNTGNTYRWSGSVYVRLNPDEITFATTSDIDELFN